MIIGGLVRAHPAVALPSHLPVAAEAVGVLLLLRSFASGCSALTGVEAIANAVPSFRRPQRQWKEWDPGVKLIALHSKHRDLGPPIVDFLRDLESQDKFHRIVVLIPEVQPARPWQRVLHNQRGFVLDRAIQKGTDNVVICRLHFRRSIWSIRS